MTILSNSSIATFFLPKPLHLGLQNPPLRSPLATTSPWQGEEINFPSLFKEGWTSQTDGVVQDPTGRQVATTSPFRQRRIRPKADSNLDESALGGKGRKLISPPYSRRGGPAEGGDGEVVLREKKFHSKNYLLTSCQFTRYINNMFDRLLKNHLPQTSFFLFGPRQVGKSTLLSKTPADLTVDLLDPALQLEYNKEPNLLRRQIDELKPNAVVFIDEVQKVPKLLDIIHASMEQRPGIKFILCGSSARKLRHGAANLLGGRAVYRTMHPLTRQELADAFDLSSVLAYGSLPRVYTSLHQKKTKEAQDLLRAYVITYLREEIKSEALVRNLQGFQNFLEIAAAQYTQQINFSLISRDCQVATSTVREYYSILEDTLLGFFLFPYLTSERKRMSHQPKFYFFDNGVTRALLGTLQDRPARFERGALFEQWIIQEVNRFNEYHQKDWKLSFWKTTHGAEVDLLISRGPRILAAIECKSSSQLSTSDLSGLSSFHETNPNVPCTIVAAVSQPAKLSFARVIPVQDLSKMLMEI
jgi:predicted AAA+ superfamily ATPase